jgi:hypothetical protein
MTELRVSAAKELPGLRGKRDELARLAVLLSAVERCWSAVPG